jgi:hypothetical protein
MASIIDFTFTGKASGSLAGVNFTATDLVITGTYDTAAITLKSSAVYAALVASISVAINGMDRITVNDPVYLFVSTSSTRVGINNNGTFGLYQATSPDYFGTWHLSTPIGPVVTASASIAAAGSTQTTGGALVFTGSSSSGTFTAKDADAVPESASGRRAVLSTQRESYLQ